MNRTLLILLCLAASVPGCAHLPPGSLAAPPLSAPAATVHVYLVRGFQDWYSDGIETLKDCLIHQGIDARSFAESPWQQLADALAAAKLPRTHLVLIGFSYGADDVVAIAAQLRKASTPVQLLITIDPVTPGPVPSNAKQCVNFYQSNGLWDAFPWLRGIPLHRQTGDAQPLTNLNLRDHPELLQPNTSHATIAANPRVHAAIMALVRSAAHS